MLSSWVPHWVVGDYVGEGDDHSYEDDDDNYEDDIDSYGDDVESYGDNVDSYEDDADSYEDDDDSYEGDDVVAVYSSLRLVVGSPSENSASKSPQILESGWNEAKRSQASTKYGMRSNTEIHQVWASCTIHLIFDQ